MVAVVVQFLWILFYSMFICGCHFHAEAVAVGLVPVVWGFFPLVAYRTKRERLIAYATTALSIFWLFLTWDSNIRFAFHR